jgi:hypothetical protein
MGRHSRRSDHHSPPAAESIYLPLLPFANHTADCTLLLRRLVLRLRRRGGKPQAHVSQLSGDTTK